MSTKPAHTYTLPWPPGSNIVADGIDASGDFMPRHAGIRKPWQDTFLDQHVAVANAARFYFHAHLPGVRLRNHTLDQFPLSTRHTDLRRLHRCRHTGSSS
jgi:hypothetical protein